MAKTNDLMVTVLAVLGMVGCSTKTEMGLAPMPEDAENEAWWDDDGSTASTDDGGTGGVDPEDDDDDDDDSEAEDDDSEAEDDEDDEGEDEDDEDDEGEDDTAEEEGEAFIWGELEDSGPDREGWGGIEVIEGGVELCLIGFELQQTATLSDCSDCTSAFTVSVGQVEVEQDTSCAAAGFDPTTLEGTVWSVGISGEDAYLKVDGSWQEMGESWTEDDVIGWELWLEQG